MPANILQPTDDNGRAVPVLGVRGATVSASVPEGAAIAATAFPAGTAVGSVLRVAPASPCYIAFGGAGVTVGTSDMILISPEYFKVAEGQTHFRAYGITAGPISVTLMG